jgi:hypothetical protein
MKRTFYFLLSLIALFQTNVFAQLNLSGQLRTRSELRHGQGSLPAKNTSAAFFTSQRTRFNVNYTMPKLKFFTAIQDVRVWGQDASTINRTTNDANDGLMIHEAWAEYQFADTASIFESISLKIGRQELAYTDQRLLGNLDWLQQARRHDMAKLMIGHKGWNIHLAAAFNQNAELKANTVYNGVPTGYGAGTNGIGTAYKSMQVLYLNKKMGKINPHLFVISDQFSKYKLDPISKLTVYEEDVWARTTGGLQVEINATDNFSANLSGYYQGGQDKMGNNLEAYALFGYAQYKAGSKFVLGGGADYLSGTDGTKTGTTNNSFDPLYGTPHKFWGFMDYFYVADPFGNAGLLNAYLKTKWIVNPKLSIGLDVHEFYTAAPIADLSNAETDDKRDSHLGTELDLVCQYNLSEVAALEIGYCNMFGTETLNQIKGGNKELDGQWAYVMLNFKPTFLK